MAGVAPSSKRASADWPSTQELPVYHGTTALHAKSISDGINLTKGRVETDFGRGFYLTTIEKQAHAWARIRAKRKAIGGFRGAAAQPVVLRFSVNREKLSRLRSLCFVHGGATAEPFWTFVAHCRAGSDNHGRVTGNAFYDAVFGPVATNWRDRVIKSDADQLSFHCEAVNDVLKLESVETLRPL
jgi:hypothetical protein